MGLADKLFQPTTQSAIALIVIIVGFAILAFCDCSEMVNTSIVNMMIMVLAFYFGSSRSTVKKDETIASMIDGNK